MTQRKAPRIVTQPTPGHYLLRLVPRGWPVPARIELVDCIYRAEIDGSPVPGEWDEAGIEAILYDWITAREVHPFARLILFGEECDETAYRHHLAIREWAKASAEWHPSLHPTKPMDPRMLPAADF